MKSTNTNLTQIVPIKEFSGHSGCKVLLYAQEDSFVVRKISKDTRYNHRLKKQFIKQKKFILSNVNTPKIIYYGLENNLFFFDMEYIAGTNFSQYIKYIKIKEIGRYIDLLFASLQINSAVQKTDTDVIFKRKIHSLEKEILSLKVTTIEKNTLSTCFTKLYSFNFSNIPHSQCCGDLTLENIMISDSHEIFLIDLLDSFYDSWMIDVAKLLQDLDLMWSYRFEQLDLNAKMRLLVAKELLIESIVELDNGNKKLIEIYYILLLNILRIVPYIADNLTETHIAKSLSYLLIEINSLEGNLQ